MSGRAAGDREHVFGPSASTTTMWRLVDARVDAEHLPGIRAARAHARAAAWAAGAAPAQGQWLHLDVDATITIDHSDNKQDAAATWKKTWGHHSLLVFWTAPLHPHGPCVTSLLERTRGPQSRLTIATMKRAAAVVTTLAASGLALMWSAGTASAEPVPQPGAACYEGWVGTQTETPSHDITLVCAKTDQGTQWQSAAIQRPVTEWFTYGPEKVLTGDATDTVDVVSGDWWLGVFQGDDTGSPCVAEQTAAGGTPQVSNSSNLRDPISFKLVPNLVTLKLQGTCHWRIYNEPFYLPSP